MISAVHMCLFILFAQTSTSELTEISDQEMCDRTIVKTECELPALATKANVKGTVTLVIVVEKDGLTGSIKVVRGHPLLQRPAVDCAKQWKFLATGEKYRGEVRVFVGKEGVVK